MNSAAVVTGAGRGLGRHIALGLARKGFAVLVTDVDGEAAEVVAAEIGGAARALTQDVREPSSHREAAQLAAEMGDLRVWVNNAGVLSTGAAWQVDETDLRRLVDVNLMGVIWGSRAAVDAMRVRRDTGTSGRPPGHIINIASLSAIVPAPGLAVYAATKHAVLGFSVSLQGDLQHEALPIRVSAVCPDAIDTDMVRGVADDESADLLFSSARPLTAERVAEVVVDLVDRPRLVAIYPPMRAALARAFQPFPSLGLRVLEQFRRRGARHRRQRP